MRNGFAIVLLALVPVAIFFAAFRLTDAAPAEVEYVHHALQYVEAELPNGERVGCVLYKDTSKAGLSCDWSELKAQP